MFPVTGMAPWDRSLHRDDAGRKAHVDPGAGPKEGVMRGTVGLLALVITVAGPAGAAGPKKPRLDLRATPRMSFSPTEILVIAELVGGEEVEEFYCPGLEWDWDDGARSTHESDCAPFQPGTEFERRFTARHAYGAPGEYNIRVTMRRASRSLAVASARIIVHPGLGQSY